MKSDMDCLKRKLVFGDEEQIKVIRFLEGEAEHEEETRSKVESGELKRYEVAVEFEGTAYIQVVAKNPIEAKRKAEEIADIHDFNDIDVTAIHANELE